MRFLGIGAVLAICVLQISSADWSALKETQKKLEAEVEKELRNFVDYKDNVTIDLYWHMNQMISDSVEEALGVIPASKENDQRECHEALANQMFDTRAMVVEAIEPCINEYHDGIVPTLTNFDSLSYTGENLLQELQEADLNCKSDSDKDKCFKAKLEELKSSLKALRAQAVDAQAESVSTNETHQKRAKECLKNPVQRSKKELVAIARAITPSCA